MSQNVTIAAQKQMADDFNTEHVDGSTMSLSLTVRRWVGGSLGHVYHPGNTRFVGGCVGSIRSF